ncbi:MAG: stage II sporulation protein D [Firmicutes bacterium]|nr:stage II sporulation protein D [Bacillota bacterium]
MKKILMAMAAAFLITLLIPLVLLLKYGKFEPQPPENEETVSVYIKNEDKVVDMNKSQYLKEVVAAEMPASFEMEALKAQAVAARSYLVSRQNAYRISGTPEEHKGADMCTDPTHCKAWISEEKRRESWGAESEKNWEKIKRAVDETKGEVITYNNEVISAVFHSTSSGKTENSKDVWGGDRPYLVSVESPGDVLSPKYKSEKEMSLDEFKKIAKDNIEGVDFEKGLIGNIARSDAGGILTVEIGGVAVKGTVFRKIYDLRSTNVEINIDGKKVRFDVTGFGHGVGMSQYGANYLAQQGKTYQEILKTYYTGVEITKNEEN